LNSSVYFFGLALPEPDSCFIGLFFSDPGNSVHFFGGRARPSPCPSPRSERAGRGKNLPLVNLRSLRKLLWISIDEHGSEKKTRSRSRNVRSDASPELLASNLGNLLDILHSSPLETQKEP
jgi:hypothetical protein